MPNPTPAEVLRLAQQYVAHFERLLDRAAAGSPGIREVECRGYLRLWTSIRDKDGRWDRLTRPEQHEVLDAIEAEE